MMDFDIIRVKYAEEIWSYNQGTRNVFLKRYDANLATKSTINKWQDYCNENKNRIKKLEKGQKVFFMSDVVFPRRKFGKSFPDNKMVNSIDKCDVIIYNNDTFRSKLNHYSWVYTYNVTADDVWYKQDISGFKSVRKESGSYYPIPDEVMKDIEGITSSDKIYMEVSDLTLPSENVLDKEAFSKINNMLGSKNAEMVGLGMNVLTSYNYATEKFRVSMLLRLNDANILRQGYKKNVEIKTLLSKIRKDFPTHSVDFKYWTNIMLENPEDEIVKLQFNNYIKSLGIKRDVKLEYVNTD